jgi:hypothetical protein
MNSEDLPPHYTRYEQYPPVTALQRSAGARLVCINLCCTRQDEMTRPVTQVGWCVRRCHARRDGAIEQAMQPCHARCEHDGPCHAWWIVVKKS